MFSWIIIYIIIINIISFFLMFLDKQRAIKHNWRIPEKTLFLSALLGGSLGSFLGMYIFRHKTKHWYFVIGMPVIFLCQMVLVFLCIYMFSGCKP